MQIQPNSKIIHEERRFESDYPIHLPRRIYYSPEVSPSYMHYHNYLEIGLCVRGSGVFFIDSEIYPFGEGDISLIFPGEIHIAQSTKDDPSLWAFITVSTDMLFEGYPDAEKIASLVHAESRRGGIYGAAGVSAQYMRRLCDIVARHDKNDLLYIASLVLCILCELCGEGESETHELSVMNRKNIAVIAPAVIYITGNYAENITADELCEMCHISGVHLRRVFGEVFGLSPFEYLYKIRINRACAALCGTQKSISEIAEDVGYSSLSSFNRHFKAVTGKTPTEYRKRA